LRRKIYDFLLKNMSDEHKFQLTAKLCQDILGAVVENMIDISNPAASSVLTDTLEILSNPVCAWMTIISFF